MSETDESVTSVLDDADEDNDMHEISSPEDYDLTTHQTTSRQLKSADDINKSNDENIDDNIDELGDDMHEDIDANSEYEFTEQDSHSCLRCLCMTVNECRPTFCGSGNPCGLYRISKLYWIDGGRPTIAGGSTDNEDQDYLTCVNDDTCSATVIQQYYNRYKRDCNMDSIVDCRDQIALHLLGPSGCLTDNLNNIHSIRMKNCLIESSLNYFSYFSEETDW